MLEITGQAALTLCCLCRFIPYCSSDVWSGATAKTEQSMTLGDTHIQDNHQRDRFFVLFFNIFASLF